MDLMSLMENKIKPVLRRHSPPQNRKPVRCIDTGVIYDCVRDAADILIGLEGMASASMLMHAGTVMTGLKEAVIKVLLWP